MVLLGDRIRKIREDKGLSQKEVALKVDIDRDNTLELKLIK